MISGLLLKGNDLQQQINISKCISEQDGKHSHSNIRCKNLIGFLVLQNTGTVSVSDILYILYRNF